MSEDRHTFSEPRPIAGLTLPSWDVDVFRDGVPEPILTLRVDETNLPPRRSKKKKIVWRLPETVDQSPRFGDYEKRRLLDIFKSLKKERRKSKRGSETGGGGSSIGGSDTVDADDSKDFGPSVAASSSENDPPEGAKQNGSSTANGNNIINTNNNNNIGSQPKTQNGSTHYQTKDSDSIAANGTTTAAPANPTTMGMERLSVEQSTPSSVPPAPPPGMIHMARSQSVPEARSGIPMPPPGLAPQPPLPPPIQQQQQQQQQPPPMPAPGFEKSPVPAANSSPTMNPSLLPTPSQRPAPSRFFNIPPNMPHEMFAQQVANLYISLLQTGQIEELFLYYATTAQKSLSLKSAKSICATPLEMKTQLQSLVGCAFVVQGITVQVQQPAQQSLQQQQQSPNQNQNNDYILLIWSGICQVQGQQHGFCHTLILTPLAAAATHNGNANGGAGVLPRGYQIQNDALVLLANE